MGTTDQDADLADSATEERLQPRRTRTERRSPAAARHDLGAGPFHPSESQTDTEIVSTLLPLSGRVRPGDLLIVGEDGTLHAAVSTADPTVIGIAAGEPVEVEGQRMVVVSSFGIVELNVDASHGAILPGDLLFSSPTPGHAMRAYGEIPGTIVAKALEPLESGSGTIRAVVMLR